MPPSSLASRPLAASLLAFTGVEPSSRLRDLQLIVLPLLLGRLVLRSTYRFCIARANARVGATGLVHPSPGVTQLHPAF